MTIAELRERSNQALSRVPKDLLVVAIVLLASTASFGLGMLTQRDIGGVQGQGSAHGLWIENVASTTAHALPASPVEAEAVAAPIPVVSAGTIVAPGAGKYLASKNGTKYYLPTCSGAKRIKDENKIWFATIEDAKASGRTAAANCPGL